MQSVSPSSPPRVEAAALEEIFEVLPVFLNRPPTYLTLSQRRDLEALRRGAARFVQFRLRQIASEQAITERAGQSVAKLLAEIERRRAEESVTRPPEEVESTQDGPKADQGAGKTKGKNIDARMLKVATENPESHDWDSEQWAAHLGCQAGTVRGTKTWKEHLRMVRAAKLLTRAEVKKLANGPSARRK